MKVRNLLVYLFFGIMILSCKKDKLEGETAILEGKWNWIYTDHNYGWCKGDDLFETISFELVSYSVLFEKKGYVNFFENEDLLDRNRIVVNDFSPSEHYDYWFFIALNNKSDKLLRGGIRNDTLVLTTYPYVPIEGCEIYESYFIRK